MGSIHILGTGAMGSLWGSYFPQSQQVIYLSTQHRAHYEFNKLPQQQSFKRPCLNIHTLKPDYKIHRLIMTCKAFDSQSSFQQLLPHLSDDCEVLLIQNGLGSQQQVQTLAPHLAIYACSSTEGVFKQDAHTLVHAGKGINAIGPFSESANLARLQSWLDAQHFQWHNDIHPILWRKLIINSAINPLTALFQCQNGELINNPSYLQSMTLLCNELDSLIQHLGLPLPSALELAREVCINTAKNFSSMYQDVKHNRPCEIDFITGYIIRTCQQLDLECPHHIEVYEAIKELKLGDS